MDNSVALEGFGGGGSNSLNFKVVGGTTAPVNPKENTIWVNTDVKITSWHFGAEEPNVYNIKAHPHNSWVLLAPHKLSAGDILNFTLPVTVSSDYETIRILDPYTGKAYCMRELNGTAPGGWPSAGRKLSVRISDDANLINGWGADGTAYMMRWDSYYHEEGTVWITTGTSSPVAMNALKKNSITVYPISAKQYISGAWVDKTAKSYQNGAWVDWWNGTLYSPGDEYTAITGGWIPTTDNFGVSGTAVAPTVTKNDANLYMVPYGEEGKGFVGSLRTAKSVDISSYSRLVFDVSANSGSYTELYFAVAKDTSGFAASVKKGSMNTNVGFDRQTLTLDISGLSGLFYVVVCAYTASAECLKPTIYNVYLE